MTAQPLIIKQKLQILKPPQQVFEGIVNPAQMTNYFISESSGRMEEGKVLTWRFPEFDMEFPVRVRKVEQDKYISFYWDHEDIEMLVEIRLEPAGDDATIVTVTEKSAGDKEAGLDWLKGNTGGWANFLACLKAWLEYGINLRKGAYEYMRGEIEK